MQANSTYRRLRPWAPLIAAMLLIASNSAAASAQQIAWSGCPELAGFQCGSLRVPLDRAAPQLGSVRLAASRIQAAENPSRSAVVGLAGGPGQAALPLRQSFARVLSSAITTRDLLIFDQRGTGESDALQCRSLRSEPTLLRAELGCAQELGVARGLYRTIDSVEDIENLRLAGGYERLVLFGVSYGTKVAQAYASRYPERVEALVLDSVVLPDGPDPFRRSSLTATRRVMRDLCAKKACRAATPSVVSDLSTVARRLGGRRITGRVTATNGKSTTQSIDQLGLLGVLFAGDLNPTLRAELPGSMRAARKGDWRPLLRLTRRVRTSSGNSAAAPFSDSSALFLATTCEEVRFPWPRAAAADQRWASAQQAADEISSAERGPFSARTALQAGSAPLCVGWPTDGPAPPDPGPLPQVPTLILSGQMDLRTPVEDARKAGSAIPAARLVQIAYAGHSVLTSDRSRCATDAVTAFFAQAPEPACALTDNPYRPTPRPPASFRSTRPVAGYNGVTGRGIALLRSTVTDARRQVVGEALEQERIPAQVGGLRSGLVKARVSGDALKLTLRRYSYVPRTFVSGRFSTDKGGVLTVRGPGLRGRLRLSISGAVSGKINGRKVRTGRSASVSSVWNPTPDELLAVAAG
jgi:pimeloyl-ACP methyl ester carboxylesterase